MVRHVPSVISGELGSDFTGVQIAAGECTWGSDVGYVCGPYKPVNDKRIFRRTIAGRRMRGGPEFLAGLGVQCRHGVLGPILESHVFCAGKEHDVVLNDQYGAERGVHAHVSPDRLGSPKTLTVFTVQADHALSVMEIDSLVVHGKGQLQKR